MHGPCEFVSDWGLELIRRGLAIPSAAVLSEDPGYGRSLLERLRYAKPFKKRMFERCGSRELFELHHALSQHPWTDADYQLDMEVGGW